MPTLEHRRVVPLGKFVTIMRRPMNRFLSFLYYMGPSFLKHEPTAEDVYKMIDKDTTLQSTASALNLPEDKDPSLDDSLVKAKLDEFEVVLILERLDESLVLMKRHFGWSLLDVMFLTVNEGCGHMRPWDYYVVKCPLKVTDLRSAAINKLRKKLRIDIKLYEAAVTRLDAMIAQHDPVEFAHDLAMLRHLNAQLAKQCEQDPTHHQCMLYSLGDGPHGYEDLARDCSTEPRSGGRYGPRIGCRLAYNSLLSPEQFTGNVFSRATAKPDEKFE